MLQFQYVLTATMENGLVFSPQRVLNVLPVIVALGTSVTKDTEALVPMGNTAQQAQFTGISA